MKHVGLFNPESVRRGVLGTTEASQICPSKRQSKKSSADFALGQLPANHPKKDFAEKSEEGELPTLASHWGEKNPEAENSNRFTLIQSLTLISLKIGGDRMTF